MPIIHLILYFIRDKEGIIRDKIPFFARTEHTSKKECFVKFFVVSENVFLEELNQLHWKTMASAVPGSVLYMWIYNWTMWECF